MSSNKIDLRTMYSVRSISALLTQREIRESRLAEFSFTLEAPGWEAGFPGRLLSA
eukprot:COSAG01_NODE_58965_length_300_cov_0.485294_1_plen_54_part_10